MATSKGKSPKSKSASKPPGAAASSNKPAANAPAREPYPTVHLPADMWERIARKAFELYEGRGRIEGRDLQDWFDAESLVMQELRDNRK